MKKRRSAAAAQNALRQRMGILFRQISVRQNFLTVTRNGNIIFPITRLPATHKADSKGAK
jgi:hypothetical protein